MAERLPRRPFFLLALLLGALVAAWRPLAAEPILAQPGMAETVSAQTASTQTVSAEQDSAWLQVAMAVLGSGHGSWCPPHLSDGSPAHRRSPSWHRGTGRRSTRSAGASPIAPAAGSIPALDPFIRQHVASFVEATLRLQGSGRSAVSPRAPPAVY